MSHRAHVRHKAGCVAIRSAISRLGADKESSKREIFISGVQKVLAASFDSGERVREAHT